MKRILNYQSSDYMYNNANRAGIELLDKNFIRRYKAEKDKEQ